MATGNRKRSATGKKSSSGRKTNSGHKRNTKKQQEREAEFTREVILWIVVAVSLLLFISNFGFGGTIGGTVSRFFFGLFGIISYIFPIVLLVGTFFAVSNQGNRVAAVKLVAVILFVAFLCMFFELISDGTDAKSAMDGFAFLEEFKKHSEYKYIPIVIATTEDNVENEKRCLEYGVWDFIPKSFHREIIWFRVMNAIKRSKQHFLEYDSLTGIYNRQMFYQKTREMLDDSKDETFAFIRLDIDRFKMIQIKIIQYEWELFLLFLSQNGTEETFIK